MAIDLFKMLNFRIIKYLRHVLITNYGRICKISLNMIKQLSWIESYKKRKFMVLINNTERAKLMIVL